MGKTGDYGLDELIQWTVDNGQWTVGNGQLTMDNGKWFFMFKILNYAK